MSTYNNDPHIIIAGCGRSGTTYLKTLLDAHPDIFIPTESLFLVDYLKNKKQSDSLIFSHLFFNEPQLKAWYSGNKFQINNISEAICSVHKHEAIKNNAKIWGQKTPRFIRYMDLFNDNIPNIKWILIYRDPRAVVNSMLKSQRHTFSCITAVNRWIKDNSIILESIKNHSIPKNTLIIKYEDIINSFEYHLDKLFQFIGVKSIDKDTLLQDAKVVPLRGSKFPINTVRDSFAPQPKLITSWQKQLTKEQIYIIEKKCFELMIDLGYEPILYCNEHSKNNDLFIFAKDRLRSTKDILIVFEYLQKWPSYLFHTIIRKAYFSFAFTFSKLNNSTTQK